MSDTLDRFMRNGVSRRFVLRPCEQSSLDPRFLEISVYDQRERRIVPREEWDTVRADELMRI